MPKNDRKFEIYPKSIEHGFEASLYMMGPDWRALRPGQWCPSEQEDQVFLGALMGNNIPE